MEEIGGQEEKAHGKEHDYSPLYKEFNAGDATSNKKLKKPFTSLKDYTSQTDGRKEQAAKQGAADSSLADIRSHKKQQQISQNNLSPQPGAQHSKRLRTQKQQLLLLSDKKNTNLGPRQPQHPSPYKSKHKKK